MAPVIVELFVLFQLLIFGDAVLGKHRKGFLQLVQLQGDFVILNFDVLNLVLDSDKGLDIGDILIFDLGALGSLFHESLEG